MLAGERVIGLAEETGISDATLFNWKKQALIDAGQRSGQTSVQSTNLKAAERRIKELEAELALVKDASELFNSTAVVHPKDDKRSPRGS